MPHTSFMDDFKTVYNEKGKHDLKAQIPFLSKLADRYKKRGKKDPRKRWSDLLKAHTLYNSCAVREDDEDLKRKWETASYNVQNIYWSQQVQTTQDRVHKVSADIKQKLDLLRSDMRENLEPITKEIESWQSSFQYLRELPDEPQIPFDLCQNIQKLSLYCNNVMVDIANEVIIKSIDFCGTPPCDFSAVAFGSLAKGEATPYSDLEYLFLIATYNDVTIKYFEQLAVTSYFIIGNVQETKLKYMNIDELQEGKWYEDEAMNGFKIDGLSVKAGNIPTGNGLPDTPRNYLIATPDDLLQRYKAMLDNPEQNLEQPGDLTDMLSYTREFYNHNDDNSLYSGFCKSISAIKPNPLRLDASQNMLQQDIQSYDFIPGDILKFRRTSHSLNLKTDIYRYPSIIIYDLKIVFGMGQQGDSWETLSLMKSDGRLSESVYGCLLFLLCTAQYIRFSAYLHYNSQQDKISVLLKRSDRVRHPSGSGSWHLPRSLLFAICLLITPTKYHIMGNVQSLGKLCLPPKFDRYVSAVGFYKIIEDPESVIKCIVHRYPNGQGVDIFMLHELAQAQTKIFDLKSASINFETLEVTVLHTLNQLDTQVFCTKFGGLQRTIFALNLSLAQVLERSGNRNDAIAILRRLENYDMDQIERHDYNSLIGNLLHRGGDTTLAIEHLDYALSDSEQQDNGSAIEAFQQQDLTLRMQRANLYLYKGALKKARKEYEVALQMAFRLYGGDSCHMSIAKVYEGLAKVNIQLRNYVTAEKNLDDAKLAFSNENHLHDHELFEIELHLAKKNFKKALGCALKIAGKLEDSAQIIHHRQYQDGDVYLLMGKLFFNMEKPHTAGEKLRKAISCYQVPIMDGETPLLTTRLLEATYLLSKSFLQSDQPINALFRLKECLTGLDEFYSQEPKSSLNYLGDISMTLQAVIKALRKEGELSVESDDFKFDIRRCFILLSNIHATKKNTMLANEFLEEAEKF